MVKCYDETNPGNLCENTRITKGERHATLTNLAVFCNHQLKGEQWSTI